MLLLSDMLALRVPFARGAFPFWAAYVTQLQNNFYSVLAALIYLFTPLTFGVTFGFFYRDSGDADLLRYGIAGATVFTIWHHCFFITAVFISVERMMGTLELNLAAPTRLFVVLLGRSAANGVTGLIGGVITAACVIWATGASISLGHPVGLLISLALSVFCLCSFGVFFSPIYLVSRRPAGLLFVLSLAIVMFSGTLYPITALPDWLQAASALVPPRWASEALRLSVDRDGGIGDLVRPWLALFALAAAYLTAGYALLALVQHKQRRTGELQFF